jgi:hypothetical protein
MVAPFDEIAAVATSLSGNDCSRIIGEDQEVPLLDVSTTTASQGEVEFVPVLTYHNMKAVFPVAGTVTGHELSCPTIPMAKGGPNALPAFNDTDAYSCDAEEPGFVR